MCGICGMVGKPDKALLQAMCDVLIHRGPDGEGQYVNEYAAIGMRRLAVIDLETGDQPMSNEDATLWIVYNGEIYNFRELREDLMKKGHRFRTRSDTEVILHAYEEYGRDCVRYLNGMFAFAIWDTRHQELFLARDRIGIKPLFYWHKGHSFLFGSEIKAILQGRTFTRQVNPTALYNSLSRLFTPGTDTIFAGIKRLEPGNTLVYHNGRLKIEQYWDVRFSPRSRGTKEEYCEQIYKLLQQAVQRQMIADVPLGAFLSGGVDSSGIVGLMSQVSDKPVKTFSLGFAEMQGEVMDELPYARRVAEYFGTEHYEFVIKAADLIEELPQLLWHFDEPFAGALPQYFLANLARKHVTVALCGLGGDELFGDYGRSYQFAQRLGSRALAYRQVPAWLRNSISYLLRTVPPTLGGAVRERGLALHERASRAGALYVDLYSNYSSQAKLQLCRPEFLEQVAKDECVENLFHQYFEAARSEDLLDKLFYVDLKTQLVNEYLLYTDILTMACSLEARVPYLDHELVEFVVSIPTHIRTQPGDLKYLLKKTLERVLPAGFFNRPKGGFSLPYGTWLRNELRPLVRECLSERRIKARGYFNPSYVSRLVEEHLSGLTDHTYRLWWLLMLELWHQIYLDHQCQRKMDVPSLVEARIG